MNVSEAGDATDTAASRSRRAATGAWGWGPTHKVRKPKAALIVAAALAMWGMKRYYADACAADLWWILTPTARLVGALSGTRFQATDEGYLSPERLFLIEKSCAGINFTIAAFGMLTFVLFHRAGSWRSAARVFVISVLASYCAAVMVNATRITIAMWLAVHPIASPHVTAAAVHRVEGIAMYFCGLMLVYALARRLDGETTIEPAWGTLCPLVWYYLVTLVIPMANGSGGSNSFAAHAAMVVMLPLILVALVCAVLAARDHQVRGRGARVHDPDGMVDFRSP